MKKTGRKGFFLALAVLCPLAAGAALLLLDRQAGEWRPGLPLARENLRVGVLYVSPADAAGDSYSHAHELGLREAREKLGLREEQILRADHPDTDARATEHAMRRFIANGANLVIATSYGYMEICEKLAGEFPGVVFAHASGNRRNAANFTNYFGRVHEARYLSGLAAGLRTATNRIGYVAAMGKENSEVTSGLNAFALGVESVNPRARIQVRTTNRWYDPDGEAFAARTLIESGCDVVAQHCDTPGPMFEARRAGVWGIGYNLDMGANAPGAVVTSVVWNWGVYYTRLMRSLMDGTFTTEPYVGGLHDGMVGLTPVDDALMPQPAAARIREAADRIINGGFQVFDGLLETNDGRVVGAEGRPWDYYTIMNGMNWYYRNIREIGNQARH